MEMQRCLFYFILLSVLCSITTLSESAPGGICEVGDIIQPGESCTYPGTDDVFSVDAAGNARFLFFTAGGNLNIRDSNINGKRYTLVTELSEGGGRRITELADDTAPPEQPVDEDTTIEPGDHDTTLIPDPNLAAAIREEIGDSITRQTLLKLTRLEARNSGITDLTGLEHARNLQHLDLGHEAWSVNSNAISDFSPIVGLTRLTSLDLTSCGLSNVSFLSGLRQLTSLDLGQNTISDISPLSELKRLNTLYLWNNNISDISPLSELKKLTWLWLGSSGISDISPLAELKNLTDLALHYNSISDVSPLAGLTKLNVLYIRNNNISDVSPLVQLNLTGTRWISTGLEISGNLLSYASINTYIPAMQAKGIEVAFDNRTPTTLHKISGDVQEGLVNTALLLPFVVEVRDDQNRPFAGVPVAFSITAGEGTLSATRTTTDTAGRAAAYLTMGRTADTTTVRVTAADISQPVQFTATAILRSAPVPIPAPNLHAEIAETLRKPLGATLTFADMLKLQTLMANTAEIYDLTGLQFASNLTSLSLKDNRISDVSPLAALTRLTTLDLRDNWILDVAPLTSLAHLQRLDLIGNALSDTAVQTHIPTLQAAGVNVSFDDRMSTQSRPIVRLIYFRPRDRQPQPDINAKMDALIKEAQQVYAGQMDYYGFGRKTFRFETDPSGKAIVYHVNGKFNDEYYHNQAGKVWDEIDAHFDMSTNIYLAALDTSTEVLNGVACGYGGALGPYGGTVLIPASGYCFEESDVTVHELGHAFGLSHDFRNNLKPWIDLYSNEPMTTSPCAAEWLAVHRAFSPNQITSDTRTTVEMLPPSLTSPSNTIRLRFKVTDLDGLHQAQLFANVEYEDIVAYSEPGILDCKSLSGKRSTTVEFVTTHLTPKNDYVYLAVMDVNGNFITSQRFPVDIASLLPPSKVVRVPDHNLAAAIRQVIGDSITTHTLLDLIRLDVSNRGITDLTGLEHARNLTKLNLGSEYIDWEQVNSNTISDFSPIAGLTQLTRLNLSFCGISDVSFLSGLTQLTELYLNDNIISDISPLAKLTQLTELNLNDNIISDISALAGLIQLTQLWLDSNIISNIFPLANLKKLTSLNLNYNTISDISPLSNLTNLIQLNLGFNTISDISPLLNLTNLTGLYFNYNTISDISPLSNLTNLTWLGLWDNTISDISPLTELTQLTWLYLERNPLSHAAINTHIPAMQAKGIEVKFDDDEPTLVDPGPKIEGPLGLDDCADGTRSRHKKGLVGSCQ